MFNVLKVLRGVLTSSSFLKKQAYTRKQFSINRNIVSFYMYLLYDFCMFWELNLLLQIQSFLKLLYLTLFIFLRFMQNDETSYNIWGGINGVPDAETFKI